MNYMLHAIPNLFRAKDTLPVCTQGVALAKSMESKNEAHRTYFSKNTIQSCEL